MPHSPRALITLHRETLDGRLIDSKGLFCPLVAPILFNVGPKVYETIQVGQAYKFFDGARGVEAEIFLDEDLLPERVRGRQLYPGVDLDAHAIDGGRTTKTIVRGDLKAIYLDLGSCWEDMPALYWPIRYPQGTAQVPPAPAQSSDEWLPGSWTT